MNDGSYLFISSVVDTIVELILVQEKLGDRAREAALNWY